MTARIIDTDDRAIVLDLSTGALLCGKPIAGLGVDVLSELINKSMADAGTAFAFGRWAEPRELYTTDDFDAGGQEMRTVHMGIDVFCEAGTSVSVPLDGTVELIANNDSELDYGPLVIVRHANASFSLYGHLSLDTLDRVRPGQDLKAGDQVASVGEPPTNGNWPPHLHFQWITDLLDLGKDFPGVAPASKRDYWLSLSPSPARFFPEISAEKLEYAWN